MSRSPDSVDVGAFTIDWHQSFGSSRGWRAYWNWGDGQYTEMCEDHTHRTIKAAHDCAVKRVNRDAKVRG